MTDAPDHPLLPPGLELGDDDVVEAVEELEIELDPPADEAGDVAGDPQPERSSGWDGVGTRRESRERALALLYEAEQKGLDPMAEVLATLPVPPEPFAAQLVQGVSDHLAEIDDLLGTWSKGWPVVRMPAIDRTILRVATFELAHTEVPVGATISEAVELAKRYSTDDSHVFVNGLLSRLAHELRPEG